MLDLTFEVNGAEVHRRTAFVWIGVGLGSFPFVHEAADETAPYLEIAVLRPQSAAGAAAFLLRLGTRLLRRELPVCDPALEVFHARALTLRAQHRVDATADAEIFRVTSPVEIEIVPEGLCVLVPPQATKS